LTLTHGPSSCTSSCYIGTLVPLDLSVLIGPYISAVLICLLCIEDREYTYASALRMEAADSCEKLAGLPTSTQCHHPKAGSTIQLNLCEMKAFAAWSCVTLIIHKKVLHGTGENCIMKSFIIIILTEYCAKI